MEGLHSTTTEVQVTTMSTKAMTTTTMGVTVAMVEVVNASTTTPVGSTTSTRSSSSRTAIEMTTAATMTLARVTTEEMAKVDCKMVSTQMAKDREFPTPMVTISLKLQAIELSGRCQATKTMLTVKIMINSTTHVISTPSKVAAAKRGSMSDRNEARTTGELLKFTQETTKATLIISSASSSGTETKATTSRRTPTLPTATDKVAEVVEEARPRVHKAGVIRETKRSSTSPMEPILTSQSPGSSKEVRATETNFKSSQSRTWVVVVEARIGLMLARAKAEAVVRGRKRSCRLTTRRVEMCSAVLMTLATLETSTKRSASRHRTLRLSDFRTSLVLKKPKPQTKMSRQRPMRTESS